jgi:hypothetical protein
VQSHRISLQSVTALAEEPVILAEVAAGVERANMRLALRNVVAATAAGSSARRC